MSKEKVMTKTEHEAKFILEKCHQMVDQFGNKNVAYGDSFGEQFREFGAISALVRMSDKYSRIKALIMGAENKVTDERVEDTLVDMACYCLMTLYEMTNTGKSQD